MKTRQTQQRLFKTIFILIMLINTINLPITKADDFVPIDGGSSLGDAIKSDTFILDNDNSATGAIVLQFGNALNKNFEFDVIGDLFNLNDSLSVQGNLNLGWNLILNQNQVLGLTLENAISAPLSPAKGQTYFNTVINKAYVWDGTAWLDMVDTGSGSVSTWTGASSTDSDYFIIDSDDNANPQILSFGSTFSTTLTFDTANSWFNLSNRLNIWGDGSLSGTKFTTRASVTDSEQYQIEVRNNANTTVFWVDEDGDVSVAGTVDGVDMSSLDSDVTTLTNDLNTAEGDITTLQWNVTTLTNDLNTAENDISSLQGTVTTTANDLNTAEGNITTLQSDVSTLTGNLNVHTSATNNPHHVTLEQVRTENNQISGDIDFNQNEAHSLAIENLATAPTTPVSGEFYYNTADDTVYAWDGSEWKNMISVFGTESFETSDDTESTTTSTTYQQKLRLNVSNLSGGKYRLGWSYEYAHNRDRDDYMGRIQINDTTTVMENRLESKDAGTDQYAPAAGFVYLDLAAGSYYFDMDYASSSNGRTSRIRRARFEFWKIED